MTLREVHMVTRKLYLSIFWLLTFFVAHASHAPAQEKTSGLAPVLQYIANGWDTLTRSMTDCASVVDPKMKVHPVLYLPAGFPVPAAVEKLHTDCNVEIQHLPKPIHHLVELDTKA